MPSVDLHVVDSWTKNIDGDDIEFVIKHLKGEQGAGFEATATKGVRPRTLLHNLQTPPTRDEVEDAYKADPIT